MLNRLPRRIEDETEDESINRSVSEVFVNHLQQLRYGGTEDAAPRRKTRRLDVEPAKNFRGHVSNPNLDLPVPKNVLPRPSDADWPSMSNKEDLSDCESDPECHQRSQPF